MSSETRPPTAEENLRAAFERLKANRPTKVKLGTAISQNNVAREAGVDPSALRKSRYPSLIREIQAYVEIQSHHEESARQKRLQRANDRISLDDRMKELKQQRDIAQSQLLSAQRHILELSAQNSDLTARLKELEQAPISLHR